MINDGDMRAQTLYPIDVRNDGGIIFCTIEVRCRVLSIFSLMLVRFPFNIAALESLNLSGWCPMRGWTIVSQALRICRKFSLCFKTQIYLQTIQAQNDSVWVTHTLLYKILVELPFRHHIPEGSMCFGSCCFSPRSKDNSAILWGPAGSIFH